MSSWNYETGRSPSYEEIDNRFGRQVSLERAIERTAEVQDEYAAVAIGSILSHPDIYGEDSFRTTSAGLDFIAPGAEIQRMVEDHGETWDFEEAVVYSEDSSDGEWMIASIPMETCAFRDDTQQEFEFDYNDWEETKIIDTDHGMIEAVPPELGITSKMRRYLMQKKNRGGFKKGDTIDMASMALRDEKEGLTDADTLSKYFERYLTQTVPIEEVQDDFEDVLLNEQLETRITREEVDDILGQVESWFSN